MTLPPGDITPRLVLVTGPSGAGRSTALNALEDLGFETIDNIPLNLIPRLIEPDTTSRALALGIDVRNRDFSVEALTTILARLGTLSGHAPELVFLDAAEQVLLRRYSETRRRHPLAPDGTPEAGIEREIALLAPLKQMAARLIDTSDLSPHDLRAEIHAAFGSTTGQPLALTLTSFSYKRGVPRGADIALDCRFLRNPHWEESLRAQTGREAAVVAYIEQDAHFRPFLDKVVDLLLFQLPAMQDEGKAHVQVCFGCTGGRHRSVAVTEAVGSELAKAGWRVSIRHRELERRALDTTDARPAGEGHTQ